MEDMLKFLPLLPALLVGMYMCFWKGMPMLVLARKVRPILVVASVIAWFCIRVVQMSSVSNSSLLDLLSNGLEWMENCTLEWTEKHSSKYLPLASLLRWIWLVLGDIVAIALVGALSKVLHKVLYYSKSEWKELVIQNVFEWAKEHVSYVKNQMAKIRAQTEDNLRSSLIRDHVGGEVHKSLPQKGKPHKQLLQEMKDRAALENEKWKSGKISGTVYPADEAHTKLMNEVYAAYCWSNPLHIGVWPSVNQYEAEVVTMTANMLNGTIDKVVGTTTSGGTESIVLAVRAHVGYYGKRRGIETPEIICGSTAHAGADKACDLIGNLRKVTVECDPHTFTLNPREVEKRITPNTIMIYASAPCYPQGVIDPIEELSELALKYEIGLHVDACLGGFVLPFARELGHSIPKFDFECPGVTSMSVDTHKYGYSSKGTSVVLYRHQELRRAQYFACAQWTGGLYITPTIAGSRPGALFACAWAAMMSHGKEGYKARVQSILDASEKITRGIADIDGLYVVGTQKPTMVVCFDSKDLNIYLIGDAMSHMGYELNALQKPSCLHVCVTMNFVAHVDSFLKDLRKAVDHVRNEGPGDKKRGSAAIYGMTGSFPAGPVNDLLKSFADVVLSP